MQATRPLGDLSDEDVLAIASDPAAVRRILAAASLYDMGDIARLCDISYYRVKILRGRRLETERADPAYSQLPRTDALPPSLPLPGDPVWHETEIRDWATQTGRITPDGVPQRARPTGRPRRPKTA